MSAGDADSLEVVVCLLHAMSVIKGSNAGTKEPLVQTMAEILFPWAAREMRSLMLRALMDYNDDVFASAYSTGSVNDPHGSSSSSPPHIGPEDSAVINSLTFDCVSATKLRHLQYHESVQGSEILKTRSVKIKNFLKVDND